MIGIISDIHGNYSALKTVLDHLDNKHVDRIICLGDVGGYYSEINACCDELRESKIFSLMGNHDWYLASGENCPRSHSANRCLDYQRSVISPENRMWLASLNSSANIASLNIVHGGWNAPLYEYVTPSEEYFAKLHGHFFASGHTHVPFIWSGIGKYYCNPGSVGQPRDGNPNASFAIFDGITFSLYRVEYDYQKTQWAMQLAGFEPYYYDNLATGTRIGGKIDSIQYSLN